MKDRPFKGQTGFSMPNRKETGFFKIIIRGIRKNVIYILYRLISGFGPTPLYIVVAI